MSGLLRLYPRLWRERYGEEFEELLAQRPPSARHRLDIVLGALDAHLHPQLVDPDRVADRSWLLPLAGFGLFIISVLILAASPERFDEYGSYREAPVAFVPFLAAVVLLIIGIARLAVLLPPEPGALRVIASLGVAAGMLWAMAPWVGILGVTFFGATAVVAIGAWRASVIPGLLAGALVVALSGPLALFVGMTVLPWYTMRQIGVGPMVFLVLAMLIWPFLALCLRQARRVGPRPTGAPLPPV